MFIVFGVSCTVYFWVAWAPHNNKEMRYELLTDFVGRERENLLFVAQVVDSLSERTTRVIDDVDHRHAFLFIDLRHHPLK